MARDRRTVGVVILCAGLGCLIGYATITVLLAKGDVLASAPRWLYLLLGATASGLVLGAVCWLLTGLRFGVLDRAKLAECLVLGICASFLGAALLVLGPHVLDKFLASWWPPASFGSRVVLALAPALTCLFLSALSFGVYVLVSVKVFGHAAPPRRDLVWFAVALLIGAIMVAMGFWTIVSAAAETDENRGQSAAAQPTLRVVSVTTREWMEPWP